MEGAAKNKADGTRFMWMETLKSVFINAIINLGMAYFVFRSVELVCLWGSGGLLTDLFATVVIMPFLMTLVMTKVLEAKAAKNSLPVSPRMPGRSWLCTRFLPEPLWGRGLAVAVLALLTVLPAATAALLFWGQFPMLLKDVLVLKTIFGGLVAALVTPVILVKVMPAPFPRDLAARSQVQDPAEF